MEVTTFSAAFQQLNSDWDEFHRKYDSFRAEEADLTSAKTVSRLSQRIEDIRGIVVAIRSLPASEITRPVSDILAQASADEELVLRQLRGTFQKAEEAPPGPSESGEETAEVTFTPLDLTLFDSFNAQIVKSNEMRREAKQALADLLEETSEENEAAANEFKKRYDLLIKSWNEFHDEYDGWRGSEGGCERSQATARLGRFTVDFEQLATRVRELPRATFLRPLGELLVEAAEREGQALRVLRNAWRPFDTGIYKVLDQERNTAGKLRRQVATGLQDLLNQYRISVQDLAR